MTIGEGSKRPQFAKKAVALGFAIAASTLGFSGQASANQLQSAKDQVSALTNTIDQLRLQIQSASIRYQETEAQLQQTQSTIALLQRQISAKRQEIKVLHAKVTAEAVHLFIQGGSIPSWFVAVQGNPSSLEVVQEDVSTASSIQQQAVIQYQIAQEQLKTKVQSLNDLEAQQKSMVAAAQSYQTKVQEAIAQAQSQLSSASSQVQALVAQQKK
jgi:peptidoglycan hydrolase CwlO-like protein